MQKFPENFRVVQDMVYAGGTPSPDFLNFLKSTLNIKAIVSLDNKIGQEIKPILKQLGIQHLIIPIDAGNPTITDQIKYLTKNIVNIIGNNKPLYIHCIHGSDRTGLAIALYRILSQGINPDQAIKEAQKFQYGIRISVAVQEAWNKYLKSLKKIDVNNIEDAIMGYKPLQDQISEFGNDIASHQLLGLWAPPTNNIFNNHVSDSTTTRLETLKKIRDIKNLPNIGTIDSSALQGIGPVENTGIIQPIKENF